ncbi:MAG: hypothetical protein B9S32_02760 [Verrucomicrobia bacterium Tous-C9LFEB]|nr:MAG: hypothetical protein B9S32_02760 [Verrucomicrobia bacterium Tous-C9LFEB]
MARPFSSPTLADVGRSVGVSAATASMALRGDPRISASTRARVHQAAKKLHYVPDPMLAALVARRDRDHKRQTFANIAALLDDRWLPDKSGWIDALFGGMRETCTRLGYNLDVINIQRELHLSPHPDRFLTGRGVRGILILPLHTQPLQLKLQWDRYAIVSIGTPLDQIPSHRTGSDTFAAMSLVCAKLKSFGYRRVGLVNAISNERRTRFEWLGSLCKESIIDPTFVTVPPHMPEILTPENLEAWVTEHKPECIITNDFQVYDFLAKRGWKIPRDIGIASLSRNYPAMQHLSGISQHLDSTGQAAVEQLHNMLLRGETGFPAIPREIMTTPHWHQGNSTRRLRKKA